MHSSRISQWEKKGAGIISYVSKLSPSLCLIFSQVCQALQVRIFPCQNQILHLTGKGVSDETSLKSTAYQHESENGIFLCKSTVLHMKPRMNGCLDLKIPFCGPASVHGHREPVWLSSCSTVAVVQQLIPKSASILPRYFKTLNQNFKSWSLRGRSLKP